MSDDGSIIKSWAEHFSLGDAIAICGILITFGMGFQKLGALEDRMVAMEARNITPEAAARIGVLDARVTAGERDRAELKKDFADRLARMEVNQDRILQLLQERRR